MLNIKEEFMNFREQVEEAKSELFVLRMTPLDNRNKSYPSDKRKYKISIRQAKEQIKNCVKNRQKELFELKTNDKEDTL